MASSCCSLSFDLWHSGVFRLTQNLVRVKSAAVFQLKWKFRANFVIVWLDLERVAGEMPSKP